MKKFVLIALALFISGCTFQLVPNSNVKQPAPTPVIDQTQTPCRWAMSFQPLYEITTDVHLAMRNEFPRADVKVRAYGARCVDDSDKTIAFTASQTNFYVILPVTDLNNDAALGDMAAKALKILDGFGPDRVPGNTSGDIEITFLSGTTARILQFSVEWGKDARKKASGGKDLLFQLENPPVPVMTPMN